MSRTATEPNEAYDNLSLDEQGAFDRIAAAGFKPIQAGRGWKAEKGDDSIGPFPDLETLAENVPPFEVDEVTLEENSEHRSLDEFKLTPGEPEPETKGKTVKVKQPLLPNTEGMVLQNLRESILSYRATTMEILELQERQKQEKLLVKGLMHKFEDELQTDPETGNKFYQVETIRAILEVTEKEELKTEKVELP